MAIKSINSIRYANFNEQKQRKETKNINFGNLPNREISKTIKKGFISELLKGLKNYVAESTKDYRALYEMFKEIKQNAAISKELTKHFSGLKKPNGTLIFDEKDIANIATLIKTPEQLDLAKKLGLKVTSLKSNYNLFMGDNITGIMKYTKTKEDCQLALALADSGRFNADTIGEILANNLFKDHSIKKTQTRIESLNNKALLEKIDTLNREAKGSGDELLKQALTI